MVVVAFEKKLVQLARASRELRSVWASISCGLIMVVTRLLSTFILYQHRPPLYTPCSLIMNDDLDFGTSVWGTTEQLPISVPTTSFSEPLPAPPSSSRSGFDDFDDFETPAETVLASGDDQDDDFGDFGDFGEVEGDQDAAAFEPQPFEESIPTPRTLNDWTPLRLNPFPSKEQLRHQLDSILDPLWPEYDSNDFTDDEIRQVEGLNQTLVTTARYLF